MKTFVTFVLLLLMTVGCSDDNTVVVPPTLDTLAEKRAAWDALGYDSYELTQRRNCFCMRGGMEIRLRVMHDSLVSGLVLADSSYLPPSELQAYLTVDGLFDFVQGVDVAQVAEFRLEFDSLYHFPSDFWLDSNRQIADEEIGYMSYDLHPLR
jgi:hypothetical protein